MVRIETKDYIVEYDDSVEIRNKVFIRLIEYYTQHQCFDGESIMQMDNPIIDAPVVLSDIADDIICFKTEWKE